VAAELYRIVVEGELGPRYATAFEGMTLEHVGGRTAIVGTITDQSHLQGLLEQIPRLGLELVSVAPEPEPEPVANGPTEQ
jgi:hypothetical protein